MRRMMRPAFVSQIPRGSDMNVERINALADAIEKHDAPLEDFGFNMISIHADIDYCGGVKDHSGHGCGTIACMAGWTNAIRGVDPYSGGIFSAGAWLGLSEAESRRLFAPATPSGERSFEVEFEWEDITQEHAVRVLRHLAATGTIDWRV